MGRTTPGKDAIAGRNLNSLHPQRHDVRKRIAPQCSTSRLMTKTMLRIASASSGTLLLFIPRISSPYICSDV